MSASLSFFVAVSAFIFFVLAYASIIRFGLLPSFCDYAEKWKSVLPLKNINIWSSAIFVVAIFLCPVLASLVGLSPWHLLSFFVPAYLIGISFFPEYGTEKKWIILRAVLSAICFIGTLSWLILIMNAMRVVVDVVIFFLTLMLLTGKARRSFAFWMEMIMLISTFLALFILIF